MKHLAKLLLIVGAAFALGYLAAPIGRPPFVLTLPGLRAPEPVAAPFIKFTPPDWNQPMDVTVVRENRPIVTITKEAVIELTHDKSRLDITSRNVRRLVADQEAR